MFNFFRKSYSAVLSLFFGGVTSYELNYDTYIKSVYRNPSVALAYEKLESAFVNIEFKTFKLEKKNDGEKVITKFIPTSNEWVNKSLNFPNPLLNRIEFMEYLLFYATFGGRFLIERVDGIKSSDLVLYSPNTFDVEFSTMSPRIDKIHFGNGTEIYGQDLERYYFYKSLDPTSLVAGVGAGTSKLEAIVGLTDLINFILKHNISLLKNRGSRPGFLKSLSKERMTKQQMEELETKIKAATEGYQNAGKTSFLPLDVDFIPTDVTPKDLDWTKGWELAHKMIAGILGVPFSMAYDSASTYNNNNTDKIKLYKNTVIPIAKKMVEFLNNVFKDKLGEDEFIWIDLSSIEELRSETLETLKTLNELSYLTINEKRDMASELTGISIVKYKDAAADKILVEMSKIPIDDIEPPEAIDEDE